MSEFDTIHCQSPRHKGLGIHFAKPSNWHVLELPAEDPAFDNPEYMMPLHVCMAPYGAVVHSVAVRPAYGDGAVSQWMEWLCQKQGISIDIPRRVERNGLAGVECTGRQESEAGPMRMRILFLEDGRRLFTVTCMAPEEIWTGVEAVFATMLDSFGLDEVHGSSAPLEPSATVPEETTKALDVALADDAGALDEEHPMNARLRDRGAGLVPRLLQVNTVEKYAVVAAGAVESMFHVPFGWHVIDDGRRTLVFDARGRIQINLDLRRTGDGGIHDLMERIEQELEAQQPGITHVHLQAAGLECLAFRGLQVGEEVLDQTYLLRDSHRDGMALVARVTAHEDDMGFAMNTAEVVLLSLRTMGTE